MMLRSKDNGLSFTVEEVSKDNPGASTASPWDNSYITMISSLNEISNSSRCHESHVPAAV